jgi:hypothetical protein
VIGFYFSSKSIDRAYLHAALASLTVLVVNTQHEGVILALVVLPEHEYHAVVRASQVAVPAVDAFVLVP